MHSLRAPAVAALWMTVMVACPAMAANSGAASNIVRPETLAGVPGPSETFTGTVSVAPVVAPQAPGRTSVAAVTFQPGARSFWHTHPAGQILVVTKGCGWTQRDGGPVERICAGDVASVPAGVRHWHGATAESALTHLAITEVVDGRAVDWAEPVSPETYTGPSR